MNRGYIRILHRLVPSTIEYSYLGEKHVRLVSFPRLSRQLSSRVRAMVGWKTSATMIPSTIRSVMLFTYRPGSRRHVTPAIPDNVEASLPTHRRSLGAAFDNVSVKSRWVQSCTEMIQLALDPEFTFEPDEAAHITDALDKLQRFMHNLKTHREMSQNMSKNSKMDGDGVLGMSNLVAIPMRGAAGDTALSRKRGWHEKMVDEHKRKASKGEQISIRNYLS